MSSKSVIQWLHKLEDGLLAVILLLMLLLAAAQIFMRNLFDAGLVWSDPLLRVLVLWIAMLGAMVATRQRHHINIDVLSRLLPPQWRIWQYRFVQAFSAVICLFIAWQSLRFVGMEMEEGALILNSIPAWIVELIMPIGFFSIGLRFTLQLRLPPPSDEEVL
ncbi:MAG: TRAP transporter small permease [Gammaproteobacteria bacterium]|nr:TRAP transporter small permease [Gammaproteobacteria bacterium]